ncbi:MAG: hypothetical protein COB98_01995 [Flavobacteriaceae bacterium]|nr:MAG: hypothetical protein COB98_01995 [Flavobacteriaceae bacterium]
MKNSVCYYLLILTMSLSNLGYTQTATMSKYPIIPTPQSINYSNKEVEFTAFQLQQNEFKNETDQLLIFLQNKGIKSDVKGIVIQLIKKKWHDSSEAYLLTIDTKITITASGPKGIFYGIQTLKQLIHKKGRLLIVPEIKIRDWPAFKIRGFMHDTGRNFQSIEQLKAQIDVLAMYKYNIFHWHLTDDPGWRLESKKYPALQAAHATSRMKGHYYSQEDFKDLVAYCKEKHITVIPEFDIPGHSKAFRNALDIKTMKDPKAKKILLELIDELCSLVDAETMPYIHLGTDEVRNKEEYVDKDFIITMINKVKENKRKIIVWKEGIHIKEDSTSIQQLWATHLPEKGHSFIDSRANYINHLDPFAGMARLFFQQPCRQPKGGSLALGGILCAWPDNNINHESDILKQNPIYPSMLFYADAIWKGRKKDFPQYWAKLPPKGTKELAAFSRFEKKVLNHKERFFKNKDFSYVKQTDIQWKIIGPFDHKGNTAKIFPVEKIIKPNYKIDGRTYQWKDSIVGGTIHLKHFFGFESYTSKKEGTYYAYTTIYAPSKRSQDFWIGFQGWSRSGGRRGGPTPKQGQWHITNPKVWVNNISISAPVWKQPNITVNSAEIPFVDEDYFYRTPTKINLKKGWNTVLLKIPHKKGLFKWMFTFVPIHKKGIHVTLAEELIFNSTFIPHK